MDISRGPKVLDGNRKGAIDGISFCRKCPLAKNQEPLLCEPVRDRSVFWVGISAKRRSFEGEVPLDFSTDSGALIKKIEEPYESLDFYRTNLVKCLPLDDRQKLRYPTPEEARCCFCNLSTEIESMSPAVVFLLGRRVSDMVGERIGVEFGRWKGYEYGCECHDGVFYASIHHPSYVHVYKRRYENEYIKGVRHLIDRLVS